jgi:hypothetical protein
VTIYASVDLQAKLALLNNIPTELQKLNQWLVWRYEDIGAAKPTKVPYHPNGHNASVSDWTTWVSFEIACQAYATGKWDGIGFVFTANDPYTFIDLDDTNGDQTTFDRQLKIYKEFNSYSEVSPSRKGLHIIIRGDIPVGRKRSSIEIYSTGRYATFTGNVYNNVPIREAQAFLTNLWEQLGNSIPQTFLYTGATEAKELDETIISRAINAVNGDKFLKLHDGKWQDIYPSQSEADLAYIDIIAYYTQNRLQITRIFRNSALGKRPKANREDYLDWMINKSFDRMLPQIDFEGFKIEAEKVLEELKKGPVAQLVEPAAHNRLVAGSRPAGTTTIEVSPSGKAPGFDPGIAGSNPATSANFKLTPPPGLLGEIAQFIYQASPRPVPEIALAGAIGLMAGIAGRAYNVSNTGLNQYVLLLAKTGTGKESINSGISRLIHSIKQQVPTVTEFIGPSEIASGQALFKYMSKKSQSFVCILGEFGLRLMQMSNQQGNSAEVGLRRKLLSLYNESGFTDVLYPSVYSDSDKDLPSIQSPAFSICGESTPERFYGNLNEDMISEGLLPRFLIIEYDGPRVPFNKYHSEVQPTFSLIDKLTTLASNAQTVNHANPRRVITVKFTNDAEQISDSYDRIADRKINDADKEVIRYLWNRAHIKALKLAATIAIGVNMYDPCIEAEHLNWAIGMVNNDIETLSAKFEEGKIGSNTTENKQLDEMIRFIKEYVMKDWDSIKNYCDKTEKGRKMYEEKVVSYMYLSRRLIANSNFKGDRAGATTAIKRCLQIMIDRDYLREVGRHELTNRFGTTQKAFVISNMSLLK